MTEMNAPDAATLRAEIAATRSQLGETLEALAAKADVKTRIRDAAGRRTASVRDQTSMVISDGKETVRTARQAASKRLEAVPGGPAPWALGVAIAAASVLAWLVWRRRT